MKKTEGNKVAQTSKSSNNSNSSNKNNSTMGSKRNNVRNFKDEEDKVLTEKDIKEMGITLKDFSDILKDYVDLRDRFDIEKNAKNTAYYFILSKGLLDDFAAFSRAYKSENPHKDCVSYLIKKIGG